MKIIIRQGLAKYKQIVSAIEESVQKAELVSGDKLPSVNEMVKKHAFSRDTVIKAYNELKNRGLIASSPGKGFYVVSSATEVKRRILVIFDELSDYKQTLLSAITGQLMNLATFDVVFHHHNPSVFRRFITDNKDNYPYFILVLPLYKNADKDIALLKHKKVYIIDHAPTEIMNTYPGVYQDFENDIYTALVDGLDRIRQYTETFFVFRTSSYIIEGLKKGFKRFCDDFYIKGHIIQNADNCEVTKNRLFITVDTADLICIVKKLNAQKLQPGKDTGIISYNESPLKEIILNGLATISTDFYSMGVNLVKLINENKEKKIINPSGLIIRDSL